MFTVCPKCALTLVVTAADLRVAQGYVRCGRCSNVFNALARLSEDRNAAANAAGLQAPQTPGSTGAHPRPSQSTPSPASPSQPTQSTTPHSQPSAPPTRAPLPTASYTYAKPPESSTPARQPQSTAPSQASATPLRAPATQPGGATATARPAQQPAAPAPAPKPLPAPAQGLIDGDDDEPIPEDALEFNPAAADVNQVFVEPPPNPEWTAATGTFKAIVLKSEETNQSASPSKPTARTPDPGADRGGSTVFHGGFEEDEIELDADFLSSTAEMRRLKLGLGEPEAGAPAAARPKAPENNITANAVGGATPDPPRQRSAPPPARAPAPPPPPAPTATAQMQFAPTSKPTAPRGSPADEPQVVSRPQPRKTIKAFGLDSEPPPEQVTPLVRARIAPPPPAPVELEPTPLRATRTGMHSAPLWSAGTGALAILLAAQIVNHYRDDLAATPQFNKPITALYAALGIHLTPRWDLHAYDVRQLGASVDAESAGQIMVRASVKNGGRQAQPLPLLRVTLQDRFGNRIAARDVPPVSYLPRAIPAASFLSAGQRIDAEMAFVDPGSNAVGFEIDACLPAPAGGVACANDPVSR
jgi:predicted Zn finger-like uncharacterized protein